LTPLHVEIGHGSRLFFPVDGGKTLAAHQEALQRRPIKDFAAMISCVAATQPAAGLVAARQLFQTGMEFGARYRAEGAGD
jgi:hypothetical protein